MGRNLLEYVLVDRKRNVNGSISHVALLFDDAGMPHPARYLRDLSS